MSGKLSNFGGKKAVPFGKGGKRRIAKALVRKRHGERMVAKTKAAMARRADLSNVDLSTLTAADRKALPASAFVFPSKRAYPIHDRTHAIDALARSKGKAEHAAVVAAVRKRYPDLGKGE